MGGSEGAADARSWAGERGRRRGLEVGERWAFCDERLLAVLCDQRLMLPWPMGSAASLSRSESEAERFTVTTDDDEMEVLREAGMGAESSCSIIVDDPVGGVSGPRRHQCSRECTHAASLQGTRNAGKMRAVEGLRCDAVLSVQHLRTPKEGCGASGLY
jgi:hypothetical protein